MATGADLVIFGASGDLSRRKILPSMKHLAARNGTALRIIGAGRSRQSQQEFRDLVHFARLAPNVPIEGLGSARLGPGVRNHLNWRDEKKGQPVAAPI